MITLEVEFFKLCDALSIEQPEECWGLLSSLYLAKNRFYHNFEHIEKMWVEFNGHRAKLDWPLAVEWAIFWHDAFYATHSEPGRNEKLSAFMSTAFIEDKSPEFQARVNDLILATDHQGDPGFEDAAFLCDLDLMILGSDPETYRDYMNRIRHEYAWVPLDQYRKGRVELLQKFLKKQIFNTDHYRDQFEDKARENIATEIEALG